MRHALSAWRRTVRPRLARSVGVAIVLLLAPAVGTAQEGGNATISGTVVDAATQQPIAAAVARLVELHRADPTHDDGRFTFPGLAAGTYTLVIQRIGYQLQSQRVTVVAGADTTLRLAMLPVAVQLTRQVVTGTISERTADEMLSASSTVSGAELERRLAGTVAQTLQDQPGVAVTSVGPATARPVIRGLSGDRILVLEDGQRPGDLSSTSGDHAVAVDPLTAERIEVVRGPMSLLYGSSALGGVVNVVREEVPSSLPEHMHGALSLEGASAFRGGTAGGFVTGRAGRVAMRAEGSARTSGDTRTPLGTLTNTAARSYGASVGAGLVGASGHVGAAYRFYSNDYGIPGGFVGAHPGGVDVRMQRHTARAEAEGHLGGGDATTVRAGAIFTDYQHQEVEKSGSIGTSFGQDLAAGDAMLRHGAAGPFANGAVGVRAQYRDITTGGSLRTPSTRDVTLAGFVVEELTRGRLSLQAGARYDWAHYEPQEDDSIFVGGRRVPIRARTFGSVSGSLGALVQLREGVRIGSSVARAYRTPDFNELYSDGPHLAANSYDVGDPELEEETGVGVDAFLRISSPRIRSEIAVFANELSNFIFPSSRGRAEIGRQGGRPRFQYTNEDARFSGIDGRVELSVTPNVVIDATASWVVARFTSERAPIPVISEDGTDTSFVAASEHPPLIPPLRARLALRHEHPRWFVEGGSRLSARQERTGDFETATPGYVLADFSAGYRLLVGSRLHVLTLRLDNLLDREYRDHLSRTKDTMPEPGRNVSLLYRFVF